MASTPFAALPGTVIVKTGYFMFKCKIVKIKVQEIYLLLSSIAWSAADINTPRRNTSSSARVVVALVLLLHYYQWLS